VGAVRDLPAAKDGAVALRPVMSATLACDRGVLTAAAAAALLAELRRLLEAPLAVAL